MHGGRKRPLHGPGYNIGQPFVLQRKDLARIHDIFWVERTLDAAHHVNRTDTSLGNQKIHFVQTHAMFTGAGSLKPQGACHQSMVKSFRYLAFFWFCGIDQIAKVEIAIADVPEQEVRYAAGIGFGHGIEQAVRQARDRDAGVG